MIIITESSDDIKTVAVLILIMLTSSAAVEQGFSKINNIKTIRKTRMKNDALS